MRPPRGCLEARNSATRRRVHAPRRGLTTGAAHDDRIKDLTTGMPESHWGVAVREMPVTPLEQRQQHVIELAPRRSEEVLVADRPVAVRAALDETALLQLAQPSGQNRPRRSVRRAD